jgi:hypothetical protein
VHKKQDKKESGTRSRQLKERPMIYFLPSHIRFAQCRGVTIDRQHFFMQGSLTTNSSGTSSGEVGEVPVGWTFVLFFLPAICTGDFELVCQY